MLALVATLCSGSASLVAQSDGPPESLDGDPAWLRVGDFSGVRDPSGADLLADEVFRDSRNGDLFQDLGDLEVQFGRSWDVVSTSLRANFKRRVVERHAQREPGALIDGQDLSYFQTINSALGKGELDVDYLKDRVDPFGGGLSSEAGFVITVAQSKEPIPLGERTSRRLHVGTPAEELRSYWQSHGVRFDRHILTDVGKGLVDFLGLFAAQIGGHFEDTEAGAEYFEGFVEPLTIWADLGVPLRPELFSGPNQTLRTGDAVSYLVFIEVAPISAGMDKWSVQTSLKGFFRFLRETTMVELGNDQLLVRVKNIAAQGIEATPIKIRPELKWLFLHYGYTFLSDRIDDSAFRASELVYRIDLKNERARKAFAAMLATGHEVRFKPLLEAGLANDGVRIVSNSYTDGRRQEHSFLARFPSWFRGDHRDVEVVKNVVTPAQEFEESTHARYQNYRQHWGGDRQRSTRSLLTLQTEPAPRDAKKDRPLRASSLRVSSQIRDKDASTAKMAYLVGLLRGVLGTRAATPKLADVRRADLTHGEGITLSLAVDAGHDELERLQALRDEDLWQELAEFYLGPTLRDAWATADRRAYWRLRGAIRPKTGPAAADISRRFDSWLAKHPDVPRGIGVSADAYRQPTHELFVQADGFMRRFHRLQEEAGAGRVCMSCWASLTSGFQDLTFLQLLLARACPAGDTTLGYDATVWTDSMFRPARMTNGVSHEVLHRAPVVAPPPTTSESNTLTGKPASVSDTAIRSMDARAEVPDIGSIDSSDSRLRLGRIFVPRDPVQGVDASRLRLELYSDFRYAPGLRLRAELRRSLLRADIPLRVRMFELPLPVTLRDSPFMISQYRYDVDVDMGTALRRGVAYSIYFRVINENGLPVTEEEALRFRVPKKIPPPPVLPATGPAN